MASRGLKWTPFITFYVTHASHSSFRTVLRVTKRYVLYIDCMVNNMPVLYVYYLVKAGLDIAMKALLCVLLCVLHKRTDPRPEDWEYVNYANRQLKKYFTLCRNCWCYYTHNVSYCHR